MTLATYTTPICTLHGIPMERDGKRFVCGEPGCDIVCWVVLRRHQQTHRRDKCALALTVHSIRFGSLAR